MNIALVIATALATMSCAGVDTGQLLGLQSSGSCGNCTSGLFDINMDTAHATLMHSFPVSRSEGALAVGPDGTLYAAFTEDIDQLVIVDPETGELTFVGPFGFDDVSGLAFAPDGTLYGYDALSSQIVTIDVDSGAARALGAGLGLVGNAGLSFGPDGTLHLVTHVLGSDSGLWTVDLESGAAELVGLLGSDPFGDPIQITSGLAFVGETLYCSATTEKGFRSLYSVDPTTGDATWVGDFSKDRLYAMSGMAFLPGTGDADRDGDVDHDDFAIFESCFTGPLDTKDPLPVECQFLDTDQDNDIDCDDWLDFVGAWTEDEDPPIFPPCEACPGDANGDGLVDPLDSGFVLARFGCPVGEGDPECDIADQNGDGSVDPLDVGFVVARFGPCD